MIITGTETKRGKGRPFNIKELQRQIGTMNILAISGGRILIDGSTYDQEANETEEIELPVGYGYRVRINLDWDDTWKVSKVIVKNTKKGISENIKGVVSGVYFDEVGEVAYRASCFVNVSFGEDIK